MLVWILFALLFLGMLISLWTAAGAVRQAQAVLFASAAGIGKLGEEMEVLRRRVQELERQLSGEGCRSEFAESGPVPRLRLPGRPS